MRFIIRRGILIINTALYIILIFIQDINLFSNLGYTIIKIYTTELKFINTRE